MPDGTRRSGRIPKQVAIALIGSDIEGRVFSERTKTVVLKLTRASRRLLLAHHQLRVQITIRLTSATSRRTVIHRTLTLKAPTQRGR